MSSFFLKGKPKRSLKRKGEKVKKKSKQVIESLPNLENYNQSSESDLELKKFSDGEESDSDHETAEEKKLRLAKTYLEEIAKEEAMRAEQKDVDAEIIEKRVKNDYLEKQGKLAVEIADQLKESSQSEPQLIKCKEHKLSVTCLCITSDGSYVYSGSKCSTIVKWSVLNKCKVGSVTRKSNTSIKGAITSITISTDSKFLVTSDMSNEIKVWNPENLKLIHIFKGHKDAVNCVVFRKDCHDLYSCSKDRSVKIWSLDEMAYVETLFGHQCPITSIDALSRERAITSGGRDNTVRIWKIIEESQLIFNGPEGSLDEVKLIDEEHFVSASDNGSLCVWSVLKKKPLCTVFEAHGRVNDVPRWITSLSTILNSDLFASGSYNDHIRLWKITNLYRNVIQIASIPVTGFVNCICFSKGGMCLYAAVGQEHKSGRWWREKKAKNSLLQVQFCSNHVR